MIEKLPYYYRKSQLVQDLYALIERVLDNFKSETKIAADNLFVVSASDLDKFERDVGLTTGQNDFETRRSKIIARLMGNNMLTIVELENLIKSYDKTGCTITESYADYTVYITFSGRKGSPPNFQALAAAVEEVKPAHLSIEYVFLENTWDEASRYFGLWDNIPDDMTWEMLRYYDENIWIYIDENGVPYMQEENANAQFAFVNGIPYAVRRKQ